MFRNDSDITFKTYDNNIKPIFRTYKKLDEGKVDRLTSLILDISFPLSRV